MVIAVAPRSSSTDLLGRLVAFDTTSRNTNLELIGFVRSWLDGLGVPFRVSLDPAGRKANLHAIVGPETAGGIALAGHVDTVPVDGQTWSSDPFVLRREGGRLYARGAADMKGFIACCLAALPDILALKPVRPLHLLLTYDEETTMAGARRLVDDLAASGWRPALCVIGEPSLMQPIVAHKGRLAVRIVVRGRAGHSSRPEGGVNAVHAAAEAIAWISREARRLAAEGPFVEGFDPPCTTLHVGTVAGGTILNIIPATAEFTAEWRVVPGADAGAELDRLRAFVAAEIEPAMRAVDAEAGFAFEELCDIPGMALDPGHALATLVRHLAGCNDAGKISFATEGGVYQQAGIPTIVCGPGSIAQAHRADEWIAAAELNACDGFVRRLAGQLTA
jgi:acetylornithine deacetylase